MENKKEVIADFGAQASQVYRAKFDTAKKSLSAHDNLHTNFTDVYTFSNESPADSSWAQFQKEIQETNQKKYSGIAPDETVLQEAERLTTSKRRDEYGTFGENAAKTIKIYEAIHGSTSIETPADVALFQLAHKLGREACRHKRDNIVDACGYLKLYHEEVVNDTNKKNTGLSK